MIYLPTFCIEIIQIYVIAVNISHLNPMGKGDDNENLIRFARMHVVQKYFLALEFGQHHAFKM